MRGPFGAPILGSPESIPFIIAGAEYIKRVIAWRWACCATEYDIKAAYCATCHRVRPPVSP